MAVRDRGRVSTKKIHFFCFGSRCTNVLGPFGVGGQFFSRYGYQKTYLDELIAGKISKKIYTGCAKNGPNLYRVYQKIFLRYRYQKTRLDGLITGKIMKKIFLPSST